MKVKGIIETIHARRDQDTSLPKQARIVLRLVGSKTDTRDRLEFASHPAEIQRDEVEEAIGTDRFVTITATYDEAIKLRVGEEITFMAYTSSDVGGPDECTVCGSYQPRR